MLGNVPDVARRIQRFFGGGGFRRCGGFSGPRLKGAGLAAGFYVGGGELFANR